jgi:DNA-binding transcriptional ArsR family regulator
LPRRNERRIPRFTINLDTLTQSLKLLTDPTRLRLLKLLDGEELSVAEIAASLNLAQPRVSTHLARLKEAGWVTDRRAGVSAFYRRSGSSDIDTLLGHLGAALDDAQLQADVTRRSAVLAARERSSAWADQVAGDMEKHYSPGRTWEALTHALLPLIDLGDVLDLASGDGAVAELLAPHARSLTCVDLSERVVSAAQLRLAGHGHVRCLQANMHALPFADGNFDLVLLLQALPYADPVSAVIHEAARVLRPGGRAVGTWLLPHEHEAITGPYGHRNLGTAIEALEEMALAAGLEPLSVRLACVEHRPPHFRIGSFSLRKSG